MDRGLDHLNGVLDYWNGVLNRAHAQKTNGSAINGAHSGGSALRDLTCQ